MLRAEPQAPAPRHPRPDFIETIPGILVAELDDLPDDAIDLLQVVREAEAPTLLITDPLQALLQSRPGTSCGRPDETPELQQAVHSGTSELTS